MYLFISDFGNVLHLFTLEGLLKLKLLFKKIIRCSLAPWYDTFLSSAIQKILRKEKEGNEERATPNLLTSNGLIHTSHLQSILKSLETTDVAISFSVS